MALVLMKLLLLIRKSGNHIYSLSGQTKKIIKINLKKKIKISLSLSDEKNMQ